MFWQKPKTVLSVNKNLKKRIDKRISAGAVFIKIYNAILFYYEEFDQYRDAFKREKQLKNWHKENWSL
jgi:putative endonuclease